MNVKDEIIKEVKGISLRVITESCKEKTVTYDFANVDKSEITNKYNDVTSRFITSINIEGHLKECNYE